jgi:hypothetical protein
MHCNATWMCTATWHVQLGMYNMHVHRNFAMTKITANPHTRHEHSAPRAIMFSCRSQPWFWEETVAMACVQAVQATRDPECNGDPGKYIDISACVLMYALGWFCLRKSIGSFLLSSQVYMFRLRLISLGP